MARKQKSVELDYLDGTEGKGFDPVQNRREINIADKVEELLAASDFENAWSHAQFWIEMYDQSPACKDLASDWREVARIIREKQAEDAEKTNLRN